MYQKEYFYGLSDILHHNVYAHLLKENIKKEERVIIKVFKKGDEIVVIETNHFQDTILKDTRKTKEDILTFDLVFLRTLERYYSDYELPGMIYESIPDFGCWYRVKISGYDPLDKRLFPYYNKQQSTDAYLLNFEKLTKKQIHFNKPEEIQAFFSKMEEDFPQN